MADPCDCDRAAFAELASCTNLASTLPERSLQIAVSGASLLRIGLRFARCGLFQGYARTPARQEGKADRDGAMRIKPFVGLGDTGVARLGRIAASGNG